LKARIPHIPWQAWVVILVLLLIECKLMGVVSRAG
jgi:hypothetical protein